MEAILSVIFVVFLTSIIIFVFFKRFVFHRIAGASAFIRAVSLGNLKKRLPTSQQDELGRLENGLNQMVEELEQRRNRSTEIEMLLREANENLENRVNERTEKLTETAEDLRKEAKNHQKTSQALKQQSSYMHLLQRIIFSVNDASTETETDTWRVGLTTIQTHFGWPVGIVFVQKNESVDALQFDGEVCLENNKNFKKLVSCSARAQFDLGNGLVGNVFRSGRPQLLKIDQAMIKGDERLQFALDAELEWVFAIPVLVGRDVVAVMEFFSYQDVPQHPELFEVARDIGIQLGRSVERQRAEEHIRSAKKASDDANLAKTEFLTQLGHELRIPINAIVGFTQLMRVQLESKNHEAQKDQLETISKAGTHLAYLVDQMTDLAKIEAGDLEIQEQKIDVALGIEKAISKVRPLMELKHIKLIEDIDIVRGQKLSIDENVFVQIIRNLIVNAVHYGGADRVVMIKTTYSKRKREISIAVGDQGQPLRAFEKKEVFTPLFRLPQHKAVVDGLGIGLTLSRELTMAMNGSLYIANEKQTLEIEGQTGNTFIVTFPLTVSPES